jgi:hypothetical protein
MSFEHTPLLDFLAKWGRNVSPFSAVKTYFQLNLGGIIYWAKISKIVSVTNEWLKEMERLEKGAWLLKSAVDELAWAEWKIPARPIQESGGNVGIMVTAAEMDYVQRYYNSAALITSDSFSATGTANETIRGWQSVLDAANATQIARKTMWESISLLDMRFSKHGGNFRDFLIEVRSKAERTMRFAQLKMWHAGHILGVGTISEWYTPPEPAWKPN